MKLYLRTDRYGLIQPDIRPVKESGELYVLYQPFFFEINGKSITITQGFRLDGASVPRALWSVMFPRDGIHRAAACIHDYLYECKGKLPEGIEYTRLEADSAFKELLTMYGVKNWQVLAAYKAVRLFGNSYWKD